ncbi:alternate-type signal peptide domain-containing protein [Rhodococcus sp. NPDC058505]|uniref:alternate-type signal peptide domain-containing protein n=1 Tax=unclassified Rhodococcus (in: high G+C Gram-positive bacteria) TaxID=192944 RepID=UPI00365833F1
MKAEGRMKSKLKRAVTAGATIVLLAGGAGLLTACQPDFGSAGGSSDSGSASSTGSPGSGAGAGSTTTTAAPGGGVGGGTTSGALRLTRQGASHWSDQNGPIDISTFTAIPGDVLTYTTDFTITARGTGLEATLAAEGIGLTGGAALGGALGAPVVRYLHDGNPLPAKGNGALVTPALDGETVTVTVTFTFPKSSDDPAAMQQSINLSQFNVTLKQV